MRKKPKVAFEDDNKEDLDVIVTRGPNMSQVSKVSRKFPLKMSSKNRHKTTVTSKPVEEVTGSADIKIKTLAEIRAEKTAKHQSPLLPQEDVVTSTSMEYALIQKPADSPPKRK